MESVIPLYSYGAVLIVADQADDGDLADRERKSRDKSTSLASSDGVLALWVATEEAQDVACT